MKHTFKTIYKGVALSAGLGLCLSACVNMDIAPLDQAPAPQVWTNPTMAKQALTGVYNKLYYGYNDGWIGWFDCWSYMMDLDANWIGGFGSLLGNNTPENWRGSGLYWQNYYEGIFRANDVISNMPKVTGMDEAEKSRAISEARFLRAWWYFRLNALYGNIPYYEESVSSADDIDKIKNARQCTQDEMWDNLIADLTRCVDDPNLPSKYDANDANYGHITKGAAHALRGEIYMWKKDWQKAINDFQAVRDCGYRLYTGSGADSYKQLFKEQNERCDEMIFSLQCTTDNEGAYSHQKSHFYGTRCLPKDVSGVGLGWNNYDVNPRFVDTYEDKDGRPFDWDNYIPGYNSLTPRQRSVYFYRDGLSNEERSQASKNGANMNLYLNNGNEARIKRAYANRDPRLAASVITPYSTYLGGVTGTPRDYVYRYPFRSDAAPTYDLNNNVVAMGYYLNRKFVGEGTEIMTNYSPVDLPFIRYAQVLLWWAEALNELGQTNEAVEKVNEVRNRAGVAPLNSNEWTAVKGKDDLKQRIMKEMHWELLAEDVVFFDELRWKTWKDLKFATTEDGARTNGLSQWWGQVTYSYKWGGEQSWLLPIPSTVVQMDHLKQNNGY